jgi:hypothetical protein
MTSQSIARIKGAAAVLLLIAALAVALLRVGVLTDLGGVRLGAPAAMNDFYDTVYYPVRALIEGGNPYDRQWFIARYPVENYPPYLPINLLIHFPFGLASPTVSAAAYFAFSVVLTFVLAFVALRVNGLRSSRDRVVLVSALILLSRPGHWTLLYGQHSILLAILTYLALFTARSAPWGSGLALALAAHKPMFGLPLGVMMLAAGYRRAVGIGVLISIAANLPVTWVLARRAGGLESFLRTMLSGYHNWQSLPVANPATSPNRIDATTFVSRFLGHPLPDLLQGAMSIALIAAAAFAVHRVITRNAPGSFDLMMGIVCSVTLLVGFHIGYDMVLLTAPAIALWVRGLPGDATSIGRRIFLVLVGILALNWVTTDAVLGAWQPSRPAWLALVSLNPLCLILLFLGYLALAFRHQQSAPAVAAGMARDRLAAAHSSR